PPPPIDASLYRNVRSKFSLGAVGRRRGRSLAALFSPGLLNIFGKKRRNNADPPPSEPPQSDRKKAPPQPDKKSNREQQESQEPKTKKTKK
ncbi:MAG: hypothetical protein M3Y81_23575, partial [Chloroflexota bacterium]|nr:hypothetical protein [Chloroflexota bacterium]